MKIIIALLISLNVSAAILPVDYYTNNNSGFDINEKSVDEVTNSLESFFNTGDEVINTMNFKEGNPKWKFDGFATTLGISSTGKLGVLGFKGSAFSEVFWKKKKEQAFVEQENDSSLEGDIVLTDLSKDAVKEQVDNGVALIKASGKVSNLELAKKELEARVQEFVGLAKGLNVDTSKKFYLAGLRYDLTVGASGKISSVYTFGGSMFIRMIWRPIKKINQETQKLASNNSELQKIIDDTTTSLESFNDITELSDKGLKLSSLRFGYGKNISGKINLVNARSSLVFSVIYGKNQKYKRSNNLLPAIFKSKGIATDENQEIDWNKFQRGIDKALKISRPFLRRAEKKSNKWEISMIRLAFTANPSKGVGAVTVGNIAQFQMIFLR